jgi:succinate dehydrogenase / fumarate reductase cytochrome b subunit
VDSSAQAKPASLPRGVAPLRAGTGNSFFWRRLHSLTGIVPVGIFLIEHLISNAEAFSGVAAYNAQVKFLTGLPFRLGLEIFGIFLPLAYHALYGVYIWLRGESNVTDYPWAGNWGYTVQRYSGILVFAYVTFHLWTMRFTGIHLTEHADAAFFKVQTELMHPLALAFYVVGIVAASWHLGYGVFLFSAKWGLATGKKAQKRMERAGIALAGLLILAGLASVYAFVAKYPAQEMDPMWARPGMCCPHAQQSSVTPPAIPSIVPSSPAR